MCARLYERASRALGSVTFQRANLLCSFLTPNDLRARGLFPDKSCRGDRGTGHASGQEQKPVCRSFPRWCSNLREALK